MSARSPAVLGSRRKGDPACVVASCLTSKPQATAFRSNRNAVACGFGSNDRAVRTNTRSRRGRCTLKLRYHFSRPSCCACRMFGDVLPGFDGLAVPPVRNRDADPVAAASAVDARIPAAAGACSTIVPPSPRTRRLCERAFGCEDHGVVRLHFGIVQELAPRRDQSELNSSPYRTSPLTPFKLLGSSSRTMNSSRTWYSFSRPTRRAG